MYLPVELATFVGGNDEVDLLDGASYVVAGRAGGTITLVDDSGDHHEVGVAEVEDVRAHGIHVEEYLTDLAEMRHKVIQLREQIEELHAEMRSTEREWYRKRGEYQVATATATENL